MSTDARDRLAADFITAWQTFAQALHGDRRRYPLSEFDIAFRTFEAYIDASHGSPVIHREVACIVQAVDEFVGCERKRVPSRVRQDTWRMPYMLFGDRDPLPELLDALDD